MSLIDRTRLHDSRLLSFWSRVLPRCRLPYACSEGRDFFQYELPHLLDTVFRFEGEVNCARKETP